MTVTDQTEAAPSPERAREPWRRRIVRQVLYGGDIDRNVKARARIGLAIVAFSVIYGIIAGRLVLFGITVRPQ